MARLPGANADHQLGRCFEPASSFELRQLLFDLPPRRRALRLGSAAIAHRAGRSIMLLQEAWSGTVVTKSIRLSDAEAREIAGYLELAGGTEAALLKEAALRGLRDIRLSHGVMAYVDGAPPDEAARIAGLPRAPFLQALADRGIALLRGPSSVRSELEALFAAEAAADAGSGADTRADAR